MSLNALRIKVEAEWAAIEKPAIPQIFVGMATCGEAAGAGAVFTAIQHTLVKLGIKAEVHKSGLPGRMLP